MKNLLLSIVTFMLLTACSSTTPTVELNPQPTINATAIGKGKPIAVQVVDARPTGYATAPIDPTQNVTQIFTDQIDKALVANGFSPVTIPNSNQTQLVVKILSINYGAAKSYLGSNTQTSVSASVAAKSASGSYTNSYTASGYSDNYLTPSKQTPSDEVNSAVNQLLTHLLNDQTLMQFLAS